VTEVVKAHKKIKNHSIKWVIF